MKTQKFSADALFRTIRNRTVMARMDEVLGKNEQLIEEARDGREALELAYRTLAHTSEFNKNAALSMIMRLVDPKLPKGGKEALLALRQAAASIQLDRHDGVISTNAAQGKLASLRAQAVIDEERAQADYAQTLCTTLANAGVEELHFEYLWRLAGAAH